MRVYLFFFFQLLFFWGSSQLLFNKQNTDLGNITEAYEITGDIVVKNTTEKKIFLMRADADKEVKIYTTKKTLLPNDTCLIIISFIPTSTGKFKKTINVISSNQAQPNELTVFGNLLKLKQDDKTACFYFGSKKNTINKTPNEIVFEKENTNKKEEVIIPDIKKTSDTIAIIGPKGSNTNELSLLEFKPNNVLFLIDVSSSMKDSLKLPVMKMALHTLIDAMRDVDLITLVTYADSVKVIKEAVNGSYKKQLHTIVDGLKAKGLTKGNKAILFSQQLAQKHFISEGNNQIMMATDGKFRFYSEDYATWSGKQLGKKITLTTVAFGNDRDAMKNLKEIAKKGEGSFIHVKKRNGSEDKLLEEIKMRSKR